MYFHQQDYEEYLKTVGNMEEIYSKAKVCRYKDSAKCDLALEPQLTELLINSRDPEELKHAWVGWRKETGEKIKPLFPKYVELSNRGAVLNNFTDTAASWLQDYDTDDFTDQIGQFKATMPSTNSRAHCRAFFRFRKPMATNAAFVLGASRLR